MKLFKQKENGRYREVSDEEILIAAVEVLQERGLRDEARKVNITFMKAMSEGHPTEYRDVPVGKVSPGEIEELRAHSEKDRRDSHIP